MVSRISRVRTYTTFGGVRNWIFVRVDTDDGLHGWGEASTELWESSVVAAIEEAGRRVLGLDALATEAVWQHIFRHGFWRGGVILGSALAAIDQALWDIRGKRLGVPVHRLLGGPVRDWVRTYRHVGIYDAGGLVTEARMLRDEGVRIMKTGAWPETSALSEHERTVRYADRLGELRDAVGDDVEILVDNHGRSTPDGAVRLIEAVAPHRPRWVEEPIAPELGDALPSVVAAAQAHGISLALGERAFSRSDLRDPLVRRLVDIVQPDLCHAGGITEVIKIAAFAEPFGARLAPHNPGGPVSTAAAAQVAMAVPNFEVLEFTPDEPRRSQVMIQPWEYDGERLLVPDRPGLGVDLDVEAIQDVGAQPIRVPASAFADDGSVVDI